jgi:hypothetical protein
MKKPKQRIPVPKKPPKVETPNTLYSRQREKRTLRQIVKNSPTDEPVCEGIEKGGEEQDSGDVDSRKRN